MSKPGHAVIYARVSTLRQAEQSQSLASQVMRLSDYAENYLNAEVVEIFKDNITGRTEDRPGMKAMLAYLRKHRKTPQIVLIDDISRLARDIDAHRSLRKAITKAGGILMSPNQQFGDDADSEMSENMAALFAHHTSRKYSEQVINRQTGCLLRGHWPFSEPMGYKRLNPGKGQTNILVRAEPVASIIANALNRYAHGQLRTQAEVARYLESQPDFPKDGHGKVRNQLVNDILTRVIYTGYVEFPQRGIALREGLHEGLITFATYKRIQERLQEKAYAPTRKNLQADFPLRGAVLCGDCGEALTACWSTSKSGKKHPYYLCFKKGCESYRKSIKRDRMESEFHTLIKKIVPSKGAVSMAQKLFRNLWDREIQDKQARMQHFKSQIATIEQKTDQLLDHIVEADTPSVIAAYEKKIKSLEEEKLLLSEKMQSEGQIRRGFDETVRTLMRFLKNPLVLWVSDALEDKRAFLKLTFGEHLVYQRFHGFRTPKTTLPFKLLGDFRNSNFKMAEREGFEPSIRGYRIHTFQACSFDRSDTSPD